LTRRFAREVAGTSAQVLDTRKTTPGLRTLEKYAVRAGGGRNHRRDLAEVVLIKENHIALAGGVKAALAAAQAVRGKVAWIEIEVTNFDELREAFAGAPDVILLDNMTPAQVREAVALTRQSDTAHKIRLEASGGITLANVGEFARAGVDWISVGALTHSAPAVDLSFEIEPESCRTR
jgi:nicotinate-nucleotide pyrophosphorylase (carboxylating)